MTREEASKIFNDLIAKHAPVGQKPTQMDKESTEMMKQAVAILSSKKK